MHITFIRHIENDLSKHCPFVTISHFRSSAAHAYKSTGAQLYPSNDFMHGSSNPHQGNNDRQDQRNPHQKSYYPYGRHVMLPLPSSQKIEQNNNFNKNMPDPGNQTASCNPSILVTATAAAAAAAVLIPQKSNNHEFDAATEAAMMASMTKVKTNAINTKVTSPSHVPSQTLSTKGKGIYHNVKPLQSVHGAHSVVKQQAPPGNNIFRTNQPTGAINKSNPNNHVQSLSIPLTQSKQVQSITQAPMKSIILVGNNKVPTTNNPIVRPVPVAPQPQYVYRSSALYRSIQHAPQSQNKIPKEMTSNSILEATKRQNQFGFGGRHTVPSIIPSPSVHLPPRLVNNNLGHKVQVRAHLQPTQRTQTPMLMKLPSKLPFKANPSNKAAYERKKQRAKDGRIRLNQALEQLSVSIDVANSQTKRRQAESGGMLDPSSIQAMDSCANTCADAKKWDRPSFIETAATLIQNLNDQCEALYQELKRSREQMVSNSSGKNKVGTQKRSMLNKTDQQESKSITALTELEINSPKRRKIESRVCTCESVSENDTPREDIFSTISHCDNILGIIASFLNPSSLGRCMRVSKYWKNTEQFSCDATWNQLCIARYGEEKMKKFELNRLTKDNKDHNIQKMDLYHQMHCANVAPDTKLEGNISIGDVKLNGVSAWASMTSRANGETLRSVRTRSPNGTNEETKAIGGFSGKAEFYTLPVIELRIMVQNTGSDSNVTVCDQQISIDASTRRKKEEWMELMTDERFLKRAYELNGAETTFTASPSTENNKNIGEIASLKLFDSVVLVAFVYARGCPTVSRFEKKAKFTKILVSINGKTVPVMVPFEKPFTEDVSGCEKC